MEPPRISTSGENCRNVLGGVKSPTPGRNRVKRMTSRRKKRNENFRRRLGIIQENELFERQQPYNLEFEDETQTNVPLLAISQF